MTLNARRDQLIRQRCPLLSDAEVTEAGEALDRYIAFVVSLENRLRSITPPADGPSTP